MSSKSSPPLTRKRFKSDMEASNNESSENGVTRELLIMKKLIEKANKNIILLLEENIFIKAELQEIRNLNCTTNEELKNVISSQQNNARTSMPSYADQLKSSGSLVLITPKDVNQKSEDTKEIVKKNINPVSNKVSGIRKAAKGAVVIECKDKNASEVLKSNAIESLGSNYQIVLPKKRKPKIKICGMSERLSEEELIDCLIKQNECFAKNTDLKIIKISDETKAVGYKRYQAIIETDSGSHTNIVSCEKISVNWDKCKVFPHVSVPRCFKCLGFSHRQNECTKKLACSRCAGEHESKACKSDTVCCVNCDWHVKNLNMNLNVEHHAFSKDCKVLQRKYEQEKRKIDFDQ